MDKGKWEILTSTESKSRTLIAGGDSGMVADCFYCWREYEECEANAELICKAVNACKSINPDNPLAVAEGIEDCIEALEDIVNQAEATHLPLGADLADSIRVFGKQALSKVERK